MPKNRDILDTHTHAQEDGTHLPIGTGAPLRCRECWEGVVLRRHGLAPLTAPERVES